MAKTTTTEAKSKAAAKGFMAGKATAKDIDRATAAELAAESAATGAPRAAHIAASKAQLARGLDGRSAPHSAKAIADQNGKAGPAKLRKDEAKAKLASAKEAKKAERTAAKAAKAAPKADDNRKITVVDKKFTYGREGTARRASWGACKASKTVADYAKAGGALKYLPRWVAAGAIKLG